MPRVLNLKNPVDCPDGKVPKGAVYVGRYNSAYGMPASKWRNPFKGEKAEAIALYRRWLCDQPKLMASLHELCGRDLVCWCAPQPCHGDVLLELANAEPGATH